MQSGAIMAVGHLHSAHRFVPSFFESNIYTTTFNAECFILSYINFVMLWLLLLPILGF